MRQVGEFGTKYERRPQLFPRLGEQVTSEELASIFFNLSQQEKTNCLFSLISRKSETTLCRMARQRLRPHLWKDCALCVPATPDQKRLKIGASSGIAGEFAACVRGVLLGAVTERTADQESLLVSLAEVSRVR